MATISSHVLDTALGKPAAEFMITLDKQEDGKWIPVGYDKTNADGRATSFIGKNETLDSGQYKLTFDSAYYFLYKAQQLLREQHPHRAPSCTQGS